MASQLLGAELAAHAPPARSGRAAGLERVADLATNVAEEVVFLVEGRTIKHHAEEGPVGKPR